MKTYVPFSMAILLASLAVPEALGQHTQADLDHMPIFGMPADRAGGIGNTGIPDRPYLGIQTQDIANGGGGALEAHGVQVTQVEAGSPAAKAGFKIGDIVLDYNSQAVEGKTQLSRLVNETPAGRQVKIGVWRAGDRLTLTPTVEAFRTPPGFLAPTVITTIPPGVLAPTLISKVEPELTPQAQKAGIEGTVSVYAEIGTDGRVYRARVVEGLGYGLDDKALDAVAQWRFSPGRKSGVPVIVSATIEVHFRRQQ